MIPVNVLAVQYLASATEGLCRQLGAPEGFPCLALITTDCDDVTYIALDEATKSAEVQVCFGSSFYAGAANASTPNAGEVLFDGRPITQDDVEKIGYLPEERGLYRKMRWASRPCILHSSRE